MHKREKAFTLVELMVAMAIIAVLVGLSVFGISTAQRVLRDNQRRDTVKNIAAALNSYYTSNSSYPSSIASASAGTQINVGPGLIVPTTGILKVSGNTTTDATQTRYCYSFAAGAIGGYKLGAQLEDGSWFNLGSATIASGAVDPCTNAGPFVL